MVTKILAEVGMAQVPCAACGIVFGLPYDYNQELRGNHKGFYCPNGHSLSYSSKTEVEQLKEKLDTAQEHCTHLETELNGALKRLATVQTRIHAGVCPCCNRHFANLERHMNNKHPGREL